MRSPRFLATSAAWHVGFIGPVGSSHTHSTRSGRRYQISFTRHFACEHGVVDVHSSVVRTTETMVIHSVGRTRREPPGKTTKRSIVFFTTRGPLLLSAPATWGRATVEAIQNRIFSLTSIRSEHGHRLQQSVPDFRCGGTHNRAGAP